MKNKTKLIVIFISISVIIISLIVNKKLLKQQNNSGNQTNLYLEESSRVHPNPLETTTEILETTDKTITLRKEMYGILKKKTIVTFHNIDKNIEDLSGGDSFVLAHNNIVLGMSYGNSIGCFETAGKIYNPYLKDYIYYSKPMSCLNFTSEEDCKNAKFQYQTSFSNVIYKTQKECDKCVFGSKTPCSESLFDPPGMFINCRTKTNSQKGIDDCLSLMKKVEFSY